MKNQIQTKKKLICKENIPNMLVILRMVFVPAIVTLIILQTYGVYSPVVYSLPDLFQTLDGGKHEQYSHVTVLLLVAGILFVLASLTDWLDGKLARKYNWVSDFGKFWDPIADKVLVNSTLICFAWAQYIPVIIPVIMIARDVLVDADRMIAAKKDIVVAANIYGKMKTVVQMVGIIFIFFFCCSNEWRDHILMYWVVQNLLMYCATVISVLSGIIYFKDISKAKKAKKQDANKN